MLTLAIYVILGLACAGILFFVSVAVFGGSTTAKPPLTPEEAAEAAAHPPAREPERSDLAPAARDAVPVELPVDRAVTGEDLDRLRLPVALRGYRMAETDVALDRLAQELRDRDATIARLRAEAAGGPLHGEPPPAPADAAQDEIARDGIAQAGAMQDEIARDGIAQAGAMRADDAGESAARSDAR